MKIVEVTDLSKEYKLKRFSRKRVHAVNKISFDVKKGEIFGFLGRNGAGKSTTIKILTGQLLPTSGKVKICHIDPVKEEKKLAEKIGVIPELPNLYRGMTLKKNLYFFAELYGLEKKRADDLIQAMDLEQHQDKGVNKLSKGLKQKAILARALLHEPEVLFMDEPTSGLDPNNAAEMKDLIRRLKQEGKTVFITTHNMSVAEELCDRIAIMKEGDILAMDSPNNLKYQYSSKTLRVETAKGIEEHPMEALSSLNTDDILSIHSVEPSLEDVFIKITSGGM